MSPMTLTMQRASRDRTPYRTGTGRFDLTNLSRLEAGSQLPEAQRVIREGIRRGAIRVVPVSGCTSRVRIIRNSHEPLSNRLER
jgi:hypothetical protein